VGQAPLSAAENAVLKMKKVDFFIYLSSSISEVHVGSSDDRHSSNGASPTDVSVMESVVYCRIKTMFRLFVGFFNV
jgi:hypothetical protein